MELPVVQLAGDVVTQDFWRALTVDHVKLKLYQEEPHLARGLDAAERALGSNLPAKLQGLAMLVVQPDVIAERRVELCMDYLREHGFEPLLAVPFVLEAEMTAETWRYQVNTATQDSRDVCDLFCAKTESLLVVVADQTPRRAIPASVRLTELKGASSPALRTGRNLRTVLNGTNRIVSAVHCSDEPIDLLRESVILFPDRVLDLFVRLADVLDRGVRPDIDEQILALYRRTPRHDINVDHAVARLLTLLPLDGADPAATVAARRLRDNLPVWQRRERFLSWPDFSKDLRLAGIDPHSWDALLVASEYLDYDRVGVVRALPDNGHSGWAAGQGRMLAI